MRGLEVHCRCESRKHERVCVCGLCEWPDVQNLLVDYCLETTEAALALKRSSESFFFSFVFTWGNENMETDKMWYNTERGKLSRCWCLSVIGSTGWKNGRKHSENSGWIAINKLLVAKGCCWMKSETNDGDSWHIILWLQVETLTFCSPNVSFWHEKKKNKHYWKDKNRRKLRSYFTLFTFSSVLFYECVQ